MQPESYDTVASGSQRPACLTCGASTAGLRSHAVYCSEKCRQSATRARRSRRRREQIVYMEQLCVRCEKPFAIASNYGPNHQRYCSARCREYVHNRRRHTKNIALRLHAGPVGAVITNKDVGAYRRALRADPCSYCGGPSDTLDHINPQANGGQNDDDNLAASCQPCNASKQTLSLLHFVLAVHIRTQIATELSHLALLRETSTTKTLTQRHLGS